VLPTQVTGDPSSCEAPPEVVAVLPEAAPAVPEFPKLLALLELEVWANVVCTNIPTAATAIAAVTNNNPIVVFFIAILMRTFYIIVG
jgi:hypothetical protein